MSQQVIYICSPLKGDYEGNIKRALMYASMVKELGMLPMATQFYLTQFMNDTIPEERALAMEFCLTLLERCDELWKFGNRISEGMEKEIKHAMKLEMPMRQIEIVNGSLALSPLNIPKRFEKKT